MARSREPVNIAVLASGGGSNLQALIDHFNTDERAPARVALVISDRREAGALERARRAGIPALHVPTKDRPADEVAADLLAGLEGRRIGLVALAGYLKLVPREVVRRYAGRIVNVHPALLPRFGGAGMYGTRVHEAVLEAGEAVSGPTVHLVDEEYDRGRILAQWPVPVQPGDTPESLAARVLEAEHALYPVVIEALASGQPIDGVPGSDVASRAGRPTVDDVRSALGISQDHRD